MNQTYYLIIGLPWWPDPYREYNRESALELFREHKDRYPIRIDEVIEQRTTLCDAKELHS